MLRLTRIALRRPVLTVAGTLILTLGFAFGLLRLRLDTDGAALYPTDNPAIEQSEKDRQRFNDPEYAILLVKGPSLENLKETHEALRRLPGVRAGGIRSLANLTDLRVEPDSL
ncbi:MAG TPA: hypothetical protein VFR31_00005, partial [Thermoanaerobaculia bacterium]|nr:hypothetical protein [Thermoanaerobaculia bacterium]